MSKNCWPRSQASALQLAAQERTCLRDSFLLPDFVQHLPMRVQNRAVIAPAKRLADFAQRRFRELAREIHRDLAREGDVLRPALAGHIGDADVEMLCHAFLD